MFSVFDRWIKVRGKAYELESEHDSKREAKKKGRRLKRKRQINSYRTRTERYKDAFGNRRKKTALYVR